MLKNNNQGKDNCLLKSKLVNVPVKRRGPAQYVHFSMRYLIWVHYKVVSQFYQQFLTEFTLKQPMTNSSLWIVSWDK